MNVANSEIQNNRREFPTLFAIAMNYLLIQVLSIPCECVFLSVKETDTLKHNHIYLVLMKVLQTLKFSLKKDQQSISFTGRWKVAKVKMMGALKQIKGIYLPSYS